MPGLPGEAYAQLFALVFSWFTDPTKFAQMKLEEKLDRLGYMLKVALEARDLVAADLIYAEYRRVSQTSG